MYRAARATSKSNEWQRELIKIRKTRLPRCPSGSIRTLLELVCPEHVTSKMKHKYAKTLEYANGEKVEPAELKKFIKANGGLNECVTQMAKSDNS